MQISFMIVRVTYIVSENDSSRKYCSDSENVNIRATKSQETLVIDSDTKSENETHVKDFLQVCQV